MKRQRPHIPLSVQVAVAERQARAGGEADILPHLPGKSLEVRLAYLLALLFGEDGETSHLDHNPALRTRLYNPRIKNVAARYTPNANDPEYLIWRTKEDHRRKTIIRGDHGQFSDVSLIKRERRREKKAAKPYDRIKRGGHFNPKPKVSRPIPNRVNPWPPKGSRPFRSA